MVLVYLAGIGILIIIMGIFLLLKEIHRAILIYYSKITWQRRKSKLAFSLVEVRSDIRVFNNTFLTYMILIGILLPFIISPLTIQNKVSNEAYFYGGSDLYINRWLDIDPSIRILLSSYSEIESLTNITVYHNVYGVAVFNILTFENPDTFLSTSFQPPDYLTTDWRKSITSLSDTQTMLVSSPFYTYIAHEEQTFTFLPIGYEFTITNIFNYFPIFYDIGDNVFTQEYSLVTTLENYLKINSSSSFIGYSVDRMLIKVKALVNHEQFAEQLERDLNLDVETSQSNADSRLLNMFPFYSIMVAQFVFGILICLATVIFTSMSNPLKILQRRTTKYDVLKKMGIPTDSLIFLAASEFLIACILPGLLLGGFMGILIVRLFDYLLLFLPSSNLPYALTMNPIALATIFIGIPIIFYAVFFVAMKYNFAKYMPKNLE